MMQSTLKQLSETNRILLTTMAALQLPGVWFLAEQYQLAQSGLSDKEAVARIQTLIDAHGLVELGMRFATAFVFVRWMVLLHRNAMQWAPKQLRHSEQQVMFAFFIPVLNFFWPFQAMMDLWRASSLPRRPLPPTLVIRWWTLWIGASVLNSIGVFQVIGEEVPPPEAYADSALFMIGARMALIPCALLAVKVVRTLTLLQRLRLEVQAGDNVGGPLTGD